MSKTAHATITLPNQPINFIGTPEANCLCGESVYQQFYYDNDYFNFQSKSFAIDTITFEVDSANGNMSDSVYGLCGTQGGTGSIISTAILTANGQYRITITATGITQGSVDVYFSATYIGTIDHDGEFVFSGKNGAYNQIYLYKDTDFDGCLSVDLLEELCSTFALVWYDSEDTAHDTILGSNTDGFFQFGESVGFSKLVSALELTVGQCYSFCLKTNCGEQTVITNGTFPNNLNGWTQDGAGFTWSAFKASFTYAGQPEAGLWQDALTVGVCYDYSVTFLPADGMANELWEIRNGSTVLYSNNFLTATTITVTGTFTATDTAFGVYAISTAHGYVDDIIVTISVNCTEAEGCTDSILIKTYSTDCENKIIKYRNNESAFGFDYESTGFTGFYFYLRLDSQFQKPKYPEETETFEDSAGADVLLYFKGRKSRILAIKQTSELMHDAIFLARRHDEFLVDGVDYVVIKGDYSPAWNEASDLAPSEIELTKRTQLFENSYCTS